MVCARTPVGRWVSAGMEQGVHNGNEHIKGKRHVGPQGFCKPACPASAMMRSCEAGSRWCSSHAEIIGQTTSYLQQQHHSRHPARYNRV